MKSGIYAIKSIVSNKIYIGQAVNITKRWKNHKIELKLNRHRNPYLQSAYNKYKFDLVFYVIEFCEINKLDNREQYWMDFYNSYNREKGYNLSPTAGGSCTGYKHNEETIANWSKQRKGKVRSEKARANIKAGWEKRKARGPVSEETRKRLSESHLGNKHIEEFKTNMSKRLIGNRYAAGSKRSLEHIAAFTEGRRKAARARFKYFMWFD